MRQENNTRRHQIVRVYKTDLNGDKQLFYALTKIKGVSYALSNAVIYKLGLKKDMKVSDLTEEQIEKIEELLDDAPKNFPEWLLNRRKDFETGENMHLLTSELTFAVQKDYRRMAKTKSYKGLRHQAGLPVRGQRTKSNFRKNKGKTTGVKKKGKR